MRNPYYQESGVAKLGAELLALSETVESQKVTIGNLTLKAAYYKANFLHKYDLADKLISQIEENNNYCVGDFDGFCFASWRVRAVYRTLTDMYVHGLITKEEYEFCNV